MPAKTRIPPLHGRKVSRMRERGSSSRVVRLAGVVRHGQPLDRTVSDEVELPADVLDAGEHVYRVRDAHPQLNIRLDDLLVVQPRRGGRASTGELVLAELAGKAYLGRWWSERGRRALFDENVQPIVEDAELRALGAVTMIARLAPREG